MSRIASWISALIARIREGWFPRDCDCDPYATPFGMPTTTEDKK